MIRKDDVLAQLRRILDSAQINRSVVLTDFLTFVVNETLGGRSEGLKEYTIGVQALKKESDFNPQADSIVRIHAGRLRRVLKEYYYEEGKEDPIVISIPKGSYAPNFKLTSEETPFIPPIIDAIDEYQHSENNQVKKSTIAVRPLRGGFGLQGKVSITVEPFKNIGSENDLLFFAASVSEYLRTELTQFHDVRVRVNVPSEKIDQDKSPKPNPYSTDFLLTGSVQWLKGRILLWIHLVVSDTQEQVWAQTFERLMPVDSYHDFQQYVVDRVLASIMGLRGAISRYQIDCIENAHQEAGQMFPIQYWYYQHSGNFNPYIASNAKLFYNEVISRDPLNALAYAYLSQINSGELLMNPADPEKSMANGMKYAHRSLKCDSYCQEGYIALATSLLFKGSFNEAVATLEQGSRLNQRNNDYRASMGALLIYMGYYDYGKEILDSAFQQVPDLTWWHVLAFSFHSFIRERYQDAIFWANRIEMSVEQIPLIKAASFAYLDEYERGIEALDMLESDKSVEDLLSTQHLLRQFTLRPMTEKIQEGLQKLIQYKAVGVMVMG
jgi:TolB-like protein